MIIVIGDVILDHYIFGTCDRISPEAPCPILNVNREDFKLGGAANVANNLKTLNNDPYLIGVIGNNHEKITSLLNSNNLNNTLIFENDRKTTVKTRLITSHYQIARFDNEDNFIINNNTVEDIFKTVKNLLENKQISAIVFSDYLKGVVCQKLILKISEIASQVKIPIFADPKNKNLNHYRNFFCITPNLKELSILMQTDLKSLNDINNNLKMIQRLLIQEYEIQNVITTLGADGACIINENGLSHIAGFRKQTVFDVTGAGDTFLAALVDYYSNRKDLYNACEYANVAASLVVKKIGTSTVTEEEMDKIYF